MIAGVALIAHALGPAPAAHASHAVAGSPVVIDAERLAPPADGGAGAACVVTGRVQNPHPEPLAVRMVWQATGATGATLGFPLARIPRLAPGEARAFASLPLGHPCPSVKALRRREVITERVP